MFKMKFPLKKDTTWLRLFIKKLWNKNELIIIIRKISMYLPALFDIVGKKKKKTLSENYY